MLEYVTAEKVRLEIMEEINGKYTFECIEDNVYLSKEVKEQRKKYYEYFMKVLATAKLPIE